MARELKITVDVDTLQARAELRGLDSAIDQNVKHTDQLGDAHERASTRVAKGVQQQGELTRLIKEYVTAAIIGTAIRETLAYASSLEKMKASLDVSYRGLQQLENIGVSTNVQVATMSTGIQELTRRLGDGDKSAIGALRQLGIEVEYFKRLAPDQQFITVARALGQVSSDTDKASIAAALFGRAWRELLPTFTTEIDKFKDAVHVMSDNQIKDIARVETKIEQFVLTMKRLGVQAGAGLAFAVQHPFTADPATDPNAWLNGVPPLGKGDVNPFTDRPDPTAVVGAWIATHTGRGPHESGMGEADFALEAFRKQDAERDAASKKWLELSTAANGMPVGWQSYAALRQWTMGQQGVVPSQTYMGNGFGPVQPNLTNVVGARDFSGAALYGPVPIGNRTFEAPGFWSQTGLTSSSLSQGITMTAMGGGNQGGSMGAMLGGGIAEPLGAMAAKGIGGTMGSVMGSAIPIIGTILGSLAGSTIGKLFSPSEESSRVNKPREEFFEKAGGLGAINNDVLRATGSLSQVQAVFDAKTVKEYDAAIRAVTNTLDAYHHTADEARGITESISERMSHITEISPGLEAALQTAYDATNPDAYLSAVKDINGILDDQAAKQKFLEDTMQKYGLSWTELGQHAKDAHVAQEAGNILKEFEALSGAGIDVNHIMEKMGPHINDFVRDAKKAGAEIPESFRGVIQTAIDSGKIYDDNGKKITDMKDLGLKFGDTMETVMKDKVVPAIEHLADIIEKLLGPAIKNIPQPEIHGHVDWTVDHVPPPDFPDQSHGGSIIRSWGLERFHTGGLLPDERMIIAQTGEGVLSRRGMAALGAQNFHALNRGDAGGSSVTVAPGAVVVHSVIESASERRRLSAAIADDLMRDIQNRTRVNR